MCGIIGIIGKDSVSDRILEGLKRLEYRGYDSAGIATLVNGHIDRRRAEGKLINLANRLAEMPLAGDVGIGHTRWATHGVPTENNAHPHTDGKVAVVHNGIIENYQEIKAELSCNGRAFATDTDTEVIVHLVSDFLDQGKTPRDAVAATLHRIEGAFALVIMIAGQHDVIFGARRGTPLAVGLGEGEMYLGSDAMALSHLTNKLIYLEEGDWAEVTRDGVQVRDEHDNEVTRETKLSAVSGAMMGKGNYNHFMQKEIFEQPAVIGDTLHAFINPATRTIKLPDMPFSFNDVSRLTIVACGTSFYAGMVAKHWIERYAGLGVDVDIASEFRYRCPPLPKGGVALFLSQSGETLDTLAALRYAKSKGQKIVSIVNVAESTIARESDVVLLTYAGPEIGVASTKAFTTQLTVLACLAVTIGRDNGTLAKDEEAAIVNALTEVPKHAAEVLHHDDEIRELAINIADARDVLYIGRGLGYPIAMEGALKLKEISYIHAEGYAAGEMKHGPIALIDQSVPIIVIAPSDELFEKTASNMQEAAARGGRVIFLSDAEGLAKLGEMASATVELPKVADFVAPILYTIPVQMLAYHVAVHKGTDVDQPRNLAKSVTVE
ncbi:MULTISPECIES: glutamine--fructose-6-phosphate transaminase (isomerizing) [Thalassospira]|jgi:glucosamine--fructose-6-phosphate aminotransferase (isomerizing)|uniref:Glutamine--fructose-6-phosphate aminotransferase [isomerizing] n=1 Tax=Thalassospira xiamenensis TaxID=220697 RepID=A0ABR5XWJ5_9PROT|nr:MULTISPECIES: glutamine--fructose-6-phosphate transaminase (isomerizing) [Thalassospira]MAL29960.1 glutamine--fructose-6-phosphate transaminase (isomerizing) [Thalassospira sp.]MBR9781020.1 glutamine--fructose-6-phosphate transaminase (isomerizing) [Rhodospirillales bacterium]KZC96701.1 glutamine--fructose-6-phosphate aminotransferase [Thalassospira xiamenensis]KZD04324.1 glutamine--fructose-6-phosphate aminotransferase [Thalassospira xiamenensis]MBL4840138.1 glutamine--fructose-6-phosphate|tara:strand:+ start:112491 stop:114314 length:1824 start_codon:yes stop_codon:yes gene_type:complete